MKILGITWEHCSTAAVMIDGEVMACVSEERFSRKKNDDSYPLQAIEWCLAASGLQASDIDIVAMAGERFDPTWVLCHRSAYSIADRLREQRDLWYPRMYEKKDVRYLDVFRDKVDLGQFPGATAWKGVVEFLRDEGEGGVGADLFFQAFRRETVHRHLGVDPDRVVFAHHHRCHAYYAYFGSPIEEEPVLILTGDAWGDDMNASVRVAKRGSVKVMSTSTNFNVARLYRSITLLLGMKPDEHEFKVMGLAAYAKPQYFQVALDVFRETLFVDGLGFAYRVVPPDMYVYFQKRLEGCRFDAISGALQRYTEEMLTEWTRNCLAASGARRVCFGGGIAMNVKAMMEIAGLPEIDELFVCPSPSDESLAIGACYVAMYDRTGAEGGGRQRLRPLGNNYLGPDLDAGEVRGVVDRIAADDRYGICDGDASVLAARALAAGKIVGRCAGRSEFGARALGNRSILADPRDVSVLGRINEKVKSRDFWMPFAPSILEERADDYLVNPKGLAAPFMTIAFDTTRLAQRDLPAALHPADHTARPQVVTRTANPAYHGLISEFERLTGVGGVLNTSLNIHGEPIVQTAAEALAVLDRSDLDALVLGDVFIKKRAPVEGT